MTVNENAYTSKEYLSKELLNYVLNLELLPKIEAPEWGIRYIFFRVKREKIIVATSVCTGGSNMPPAYCISYLRIPPESDAKKSPTAYAAGDFLAEDEGFEFWEVSTFFN